MSNLKVSIVIPVYNSEKTIGCCLDSLLSQTYNNLEIVCVNDYSKDNSLEVLKQYAERDSRIVVINHEENKNAGGARNSAIKASTGHYICLVDNDDWLAPNAIESMINASCDGALDMVTSDWVFYYSEEKQEIRKNLFPEATYDDLIEYGCTKGFGILGCLWKRSIFTENNLFYPEKIFYEDNAIALALMAFAKEFTYLPIPLYYYRQSLTSVTGFHTVKKISDRITTTELFLDNIKKYGFYDKYKSLWDFFCLKLCVNTLFMLLCFKHREIKKEYERNMHLLNNCRPNVHVNELERKRRIFAKHPIVSYWLFRLYKPIRKIVK